MLRRYELTDEEWNRIAPLLPPWKIPENRDAPKSAAGQFWKELFGLLVAELHGETFQNVYGSWQTVYSHFRKWIEDGTLDNIFRVLSLEAELTELSIDASNCQSSSA